MTLNEGDSLDLVCTGWGWPVPSIQWTREDRTDRVYTTGDAGVTLRDVMTSHNVTLRSAGLNIQNVNRTDQLNYLCTVANNFGYTNITIFVRVKDRLAAIWPLIGIIIEIIVLVIFIAICEIKRRRKTADDDDAKCK